MEYVLKVFRDAHANYFKQISRMTKDTDLVQHVLNIHGASDDSRTEAQEALLAHIRKESIAIKYVWFDFRKTQNLTEALYAMALDLQKRYGFDFTPFFCAYDELRVRQAYATLVDKRFQVPKYSAKHPEKLLELFRRDNLYDFYYYLDFLFFDTLSFNIELSRNPFVVILYGVEHLKSLNWLKGNEKAILNQFKELFWVVHSREPLKEKFISHLQIESGTFDIQHVAPQISAMDRVIMLVFAKIQVWEEQVFALFSQRLDLQYVEQTLARLIKLGCLHRIDEGWLAVRDDVAALSSAQLDEQLIMKLTEQLYDFCDEQLKQSALDSARSKFWLIQKNTVFCASNFNYEDAERYYINQLVNFLELYEQTFDYRSIVQLLHRFGKTLYRKFANSALLEQVSKRLESAFLSLKDYDGIINWNADLGAISEGLFKAHFNEFNLDNPEHTQAAEKVAHELMKQLAEKHGEYGDETIRFQLLFSRFLEYNNSLEWAMEDMVRLFYATLERLPITRPIMKEVFERTMKVCENARNHQLAIESALANYHRSRLLYGEMHEETLIHHRQYVRQLYVAQKLEEAIKKSEILMSYFQTKFGPNNEHTLMMLADSGRYYLANFQFADAEKCLRTAYQKIRDFYPEHEKCRAIGLMLGVALAELGDFMAAKKIWMQIEKELIIDKREDEYLNLQQKIANQYVNFGKYDEAIEIQKNVMEKQFSRFGFENEELADTFLDIAHIHWKKKKLTEALYWAERAYKVTENKLGAHHSRTYFFRMNWIVMHANIGKTEVACQLGKTLLEDMCAHPPRERFILNIVRMEYAKFLYQNRQVNESIEQLNELLNIQLANGVQDAEIHKTRQLIHALQARQDEKSFTDCYEIGVTVSYLRNKYGECKHDEAYRHFFRLMHFGDKIFIVAPRDEGVVVGRKILDATESILGASVGMPFHLVSQMIGIDDYRVISTTTGGMRRCAEFHFNDYLIRFFSRKLVGKTYYALIERFES